jgi:hypothetical protein
MIDCKPVDYERAYLRRLEELQAALELVCYWQGQAERLAKQYEELRRHVDTVLG